MSWVRGKACGVLVRLRGAKKENKTKRKSGQGKCVLLLPTWPAVHSTSPGMRRERGRKSSPSDTPNMSPKVSPYC